MHPFLARILRRRLNTPPPASESISPYPLSKFAYLNMPRGAFIVLEGIDRSGKSTQATKLVEALRSLKISAEKMNFPDRTTNTGQLISKYLSDKSCELNDQTIHLLFSANRWESAELIEKKLLSGTTLIVDRYSYSGIAYSVAKGLDMKWCLQPEIGLPQPDLVLFLDIKWEDLKDRPGFGTERYEIKSMQNTVSSIFKQFAWSESYWKTVDASKDLESVHNALLSHVARTLEEINQHNKPLRSIGQPILRECNSELKGVYQVKDTLV